MNNTDPNQVKTPVVTFSNIPLDDEPQAVGFDTLPPEALEPKMVTVAGIQFKKGGKVYFFDPGENDVQTGDEVIIETTRGAEYGFCAEGNHTVSEDKVIPPLRPVIRIATDADKQTRQEFKKKEGAAFDTCQEKILEHGLDMKLVSAEYNFDGSKILFYFTADGRVDFRDLVKDLAGVFRTRIELRQIGVRDEAKMMGGLGICGRPFCCKQFLDDFQPVSIKMAKTQSLSLNPTKISGTCGRLMCCLKYEQDTYEALIKESPKVESIVNTCDGKGTVTEINLLKESVKVRLDSDPSSIKSYHNCDICVLRNGKGKKTDPPIPDDLPPLPKPQAQPAYEREAFTPFDESALGRFSADPTPAAAENPRSEKPARAERPERTERPERSEKQERDRNSRRHTEREQKPARETKPEREVRPDREANPEAQKENTGKSGQSRRNRGRNDRKPRSGGENKHPQQPKAQPSPAAAETAEPISQSENKEQKPRSHRRRYYRGNRKHSGGGNQNSGNQS